MLALPATSQSLLPLAKRLPGNLTRLQAEGMDGQGLANFGKRTLSKVYFCHAF
jgi:hypothetical protein